MTSMQSAQPRPDVDDPLLDGLLILCRLHGRPASRAGLCSGLPLAHQRLGPALLPRAAARAGLQARVLKRALDDISALNLPVLLLLGNGRSAVLQRWGEDGRALILPCEADGGEQWVERQALEQAYNGHALFARPRHTLEDVRAPLLPRVNAWFRDTLRHSRWLYGDALLASLLINLLGLMVPLFVMQTYDRVVPNQALSTLWMLVAGLFIGTAFELVLRMVRAHLLDQAGKKTDLILSATLFERITGMAMKAKPATIGGFAQSIHDFQGLREFLTAVTLTSIIDLPFVALMLLVIGLLGGWLVAIPLIAFPVAVGFALLIQARLRDTVQKSLSLGAVRQALLIETLGGLETLKACGAESERQYQWEYTNAAIARLDAHARNLSSLASYMLGSRVLAPLGQIAGLITRYQQAQLTMRSTDALMALPQERQPDQQALEHTTLKGELALSHVSFRYPGQTNPALQDVSLVVTPGERIGIIGRSGSGKSTLGRMLMGFHHPDEGQVLLDNLDLRHLDIADLRSQIGYVAHDLSLLAGSLRDNLTLGARHISDARMLEVAELTGVSELARQHPNGFDRPVGERGQLLSGGQRQAVLLARALLLEPPILILDEPTSHMDNSSEEQLRQRLLAWVPGKTLLLVTHRTSMLSLVDRLVVLDNGKVVADGPKDAVVDALRKGRIGSAL